MRFRGSLDTAPPPYHAVENRSQLTILATPAAETQLATLDRLPVGQPAIVIDVAGGEPQLVRLRVMGLCVGRGVHTMRAGSRMIVCAGGTRIGLTRDVARAITVRPLPPGDAPCDTGDR